MNANKKCVGKRLTLVSTGLYAIVLLAYLVFAVISNTFNPIVLLVFLAAIVCGVALMRKEGFWTDYGVIAFIALETIALGLFTLDSVGDFTDFFSGIVMYGNPDNVPARFALIAAALLCILIGIIGSFFSHEENN